MGSIKDSVHQSSPPSYTDNTMSQQHFIQQHSAAPDSSHPKQARSFPRTKKRNTFVPAMGAILSHLQNHGRSAECPQECKRALAQNPPPWRLPLPEETRGASKARLSHHQWQARMHTRQVSPARTIYKQRWRPQPKAVPLSSRECVPPRTMHASCSRAVLAAVRAQS
jgi:hypothetical protein